MIIARANRCCREVMLTMTKRSPVITVREVILTMTKRSPVITQSEK